MARAPVGLVSRAPATFSLAKAAIRSRHARTRTRAACVALVPFAARGRLLGRPRPAVRRSATRPRRKALPRRAATLRRRLARGDRSGDQVARAQACAGVRRRARDARRRRGEGRDIERTSARAPGARARPRVQQRRHAARAVPLFESAVTPRAPIRAPDATTTWSTRCTCSGSRRRRPSGCAGTSPRSTRPRRPPTRARAAGAHRCSTTSAGPRRRRRRTARARYWERSRRCHHRNQRGARRCRLPAASIPSAAAALFTAAPGSVNPGQTVCVRHTQRRRRP